MNEHSSMTDAQDPQTRRALRTPRAAAIAGILFALLYGASLALIRLSVPTDPTVDNIAWMETNRRTVTLALNLTPFAGIAFLWFIGVIRDRVGAQEDRLFSTVFLGSGLLFLAMTFVGAALAGGLLSTYAAAPGALQEGGLLAFVRTFTYQVINVYAVRMAGVFMITLASIWLRTGVMHRGWAMLTYAVALVLLLSISLSLWMILVFPAWVLAVSVYLLIRNPGNLAPETI